MVVANGGSASELSLPAFLKSRARRATDSRLAVDFAVGSVAVIVALALRPGWWQPLAGAGLVLFFFGSWAVLDRVIEDGHPSPPLLAAIRVARGLSAALGVAAALGAAFILWTMLMGTWIS